MTFTLYKKDDEPNEPDFDVQPGEVGILTIDKDSDFSFDDYLKYLTFFRRSICRKELIYTKSEPISESVIMQVENKETLAVITSEGEDGKRIPFMNEMDEIKRFLNDFTVIYLDKENSTIVSPFSMIGSQNVGQIQFDIYMYWKSIKMPGFGASDENTFVIGSNIMTGQELMNHPLFNQIVIELYLRNFTDEPLFFICKDMTEDDVRRIISSVPKEAFEMHPPIMFVLEDK